MGRWGCRGGGLVDEIALELAFRDNWMVEFLDVAMHSLLELACRRVVQDGGIGGD